MGFHQELIGFVLILKKEEMVLYPKIACIQEQSCDFWKMLTDMHYCRFHAYNNKKNHILKKAINANEFGQRYAHEKEYKFTN